MPGPNFIEYTHLSHRVNERFLKNIRAFETTEDVIDCVMRTQDTLDCRFTSAQVIVIFIKAITSALADRIQFIVEDERDLEMVEVRIKQISDRAQAAINTAVKAYS